MAIEQALLAADIHLGQHDLAAVAQELFVVHENHYRQIVALARACEKLKGHGGVNVNITADFLIASYEFDVYSSTHKDI